MHLLEILQPKPLRGKTGGHRLSARIGQHALDLRVEHHRIRQTFARRQRLQSFVGNRAPQEE